jgi:hypothetical protein
VAVAVAVADRSGQLVVAVTGRSLPTAAATVVTVSRTFSVGIERDRTQVT